MEDLISYPRTPHCEGSRLQIGDNKEHVSYDEIRGKYIVVEEKVDAANSGISFNSDAKLLLQSRGHFLAGGYRERHFALMHKWAEFHMDTFFDILTDRYIMYGEWMLAYHTLFYDNLPHYFVEFDIWDKFEQKFLSTKARKKLIGNAPIVSVPVLYEGIAPENISDLTLLLKPSLYRTENWKENFKEAVKRSGMSEQYPNEILEKADYTELAEGLYIKIETEDETVGRLKYVRSSFVQSIIENGTHWLDRPIVKNGLNAEVNIYAY